MSLNLTVDGDNSSCAFVGTTAGSGVPLGGVFGCGSSSGSSGVGSPSGWSGKHLPSDTQAVSSISSSVAVAPNVSVVNSGHLPNSSLGSWNLNSSTPASNSHFANTSMQTQQLPQPSPQQHSTPSPPSQLQLQPHSQSQQAANPSNITGAMTTTVISGDIIVDSQDNEAWPSITSMTSTTSTTGSNNNGNANKSVSNVTTSAASTVSSGQLSGGTPGVMMNNPSTVPTDQDATLTQSDVWGSTSGSTGSSWGGPFAQPPAASSSSSLASIWGGSSNVISSDPNYSPWGNTNSVMPHTTGSLWNNNVASSAASPHDQSSADWNNQQMSQQQTQGHDMQRQQLMQAHQQQSQIQQPRLMQQNLQLQAMQQQQQPPPPQHMNQHRSQVGSQQQHQQPPPPPPPPQQPPPPQHQPQQQQQPQHRQPQHQQPLQQQHSNQMQNQQQTQMQQILQQSVPQSQPQPLQTSQPQPQSSAAQSPTWGAGSNGPGGANWLNSGGPSSRATPTNEVAAITSQSSSEGSGQTWAQAAGKGVSEAPTPVPSSGVKSPEDLMKDETERQVWALVNSNDGWGKRPVNQSTPWDCGLVKEDQMKHVDSNVWMNEPPNGTGQWEHHYESLGEKTARWSVLSKSSSMGPSGANTNPQWSRSTSVSGAEMGGGGGGDGPFWNGQTQTWERGSRNAPPNRLHSVSGVPSGNSGTWGSEEWTPAPSHRSSVSDASDWIRGPDQWMGTSGATTPTNASGPAVRWGQQGVDEGSNMWNNPQNQSGSIRSSMHSDDFNRRMPMSNNSGGGNRNNMRAHVIRKLIDMGFRREDAQQALISHNMNFDRALQELQNKRTMSISGANDFGQSQPGSGILSRNQQMNMQPHTQQQQMQMQQQQSQPQVHQQHTHMQQQQNQHSHQQQSQQSTSQQPPQHNQQQHQQQLMRQQIMTQLQASVQNRMQAGNGNSSSGSMPQVTGGNQTSNFQNSNVYQQQQLQQQLHQLKQQITILQHRGKSLQNQYISATAIGNVSATRTLQQQMEQVNSEMQNFQKHAQTITMKLTQMQNSSQQTQQQQQQQPQQQPHQHYSQSSQHHMGSNMMNQQMNHDRQYPNQLGDIIDRMSGMMGPANGLTGSHVNVSGWKSSDQNPAGWYNMPVITDDQQRPHGPGQNSMNSSPQVSTLSMDIPEFVPGKPWQGMKDDPNMTVGGSRKGVFNTLNNDHLEKLSTKDNNARSPQSPSGPYAPNHRRHQGGYNGTSPMYHPSYGSTCILIRNMPSNVTVDLIKYMVAQHGPVLALQPNLNAGWVLIRFANPEDAAKAEKSLIAARFGQVEIITENEAQRLQQEIQALAARFNPNTAWSNNFVGVPSGDALPPEPHLIPGDI